MTTYTNVFGGNSVRAADQSLTKLTISANAALSWPADGGSPATSAIVEVTATTGGLTLSMPDARNAGEGETVTFKNVGSNSFAVNDKTGGSIVTVGTGVVYTVYLRDNSTQAGAWSYWQAGAGSSTVDAGALDGAGLDASGGLLRVKAATAYYGSSQAFSDSDRGSIATWTGGSGTFTVPRADSVGNGWFMVYKNAGSGTLTISPSNSETFDGASSITLAAAEGATVFSDGINFSFVKHGSSSSSGSSFSYTSISVAGSGNYTLSATEYANKALKFTGILTGNRTIIIPTAVRDYWVNNATTGAFTLTVKTASGAGVAVTQTKKATLYCDGLDTIAADTDYPSGISTPVSVANGGTNATTAGAALTNLGGTATGTSVFTAANAAAGRSALSAAGSGANTDITSIYLNNTGLKVRDTDASHGLSIVPGSNLTADRVLTVTTGDAARTLDISAGNVTVSTAGAALIDDADATAQRTTLGLGALATLSTVGTAQIADNSVTGAKIALGSDAQGDIMYYNGTDYVRLAAGTAGQFLKTNGAGANPAWADETTGLTLLGTINATGAATVSLSSLTLTNYKELLIDFIGLNNALNYSGNLTISDGTSSYTLCGLTNFSQGRISINLGSGIMLSNCIDTASGTYGGTTTNLSVKTRFTTATTSISFTSSGGNFAGSGTIKVYGVK